LKKKQKMGRVKNSTIGTNNGAHSVEFRTNSSNNQKETNEGFKHEGHSM
jgi:hypothetical protein